MRSISLLAVQVFLFGTASLISILPASAKQVCIRSQYGKIDCGELLDDKNQNIKKPPTTKKMVISQSGLNFTLEECRKFRTGIACSISIYNSTEFDKSITWSIDISHNSLVDSNGIKYSSQAIKFGDNNATATLPPKITMGAKVFFRPSGELSNYIRIFQTSPIIEGVNGFRLIFRDFNLI